MAASEREMSLACAYYPAVGTVLGAVLVLPSYFGVFPDHIWVQAWLYVFMSAWLTRALHLDGLADVLDALGSARSGEAFQAVLKDSRMGAFGCAGLILAIAGQIILAAACLRDGLLIPLFYAPVFARCLPFLLSRIAPPNPQAKLGALLASAPLLPALLLAVVGIGGLFFLFSMPGSLSAIALAALCLAMLRRLAMREGGYNGDFCGFAIVCGEIIILLAAIV